MKLFQKIFFTIQNCEDSFIQIIFDLNSSAVALIELFSNLLSRNDASSKKIFETPSKTLRPSTLDPFKKTPLTLVRAHRRVNNNDAVLPRRFPSIRIPSVLISQSLTALLDLLANARATEISGSGRSRRYRLDTTINFHHFRTDWKRIL